jgi:steroid delta-isomerase-like uncharacterized protein
MTREAVLELVTRWQEAASQRDVATYAQVYAEHAEIQSPLAGAATGRDGALKTFTAFFAAFPDTSFAWEAPIVDGGRVAASAILTGTNFGGFMGLPPSGKAFRIPIVFLLDVRDGQIVRDRRIYDFTGLMIQVGVLKAKPA